MSPLGSFKRKRFLMYFMHNGVKKILKMQFYFHEIILSFTFHAMLWFIRGKHCSVVAAVLFVNQFVFVSLNLISMPLLAQWLEGRKEIQNWTRGALNIIKLIGKAPSFATLCWKLKTNKMSENLKNFENLKENMSKFSLVLNPLTSR